MPLPRNLMPIASRCLPRFAAAAAPRPALFLLLHPPGPCPFLSPALQPQQYEQGQVQQYQAVPQYGPPPGAAPAKEPSFWSNIPPLVYIGVGGCCASLPAEHGQTLLCPALALPLAGRLTLCLDVCSGSGGSCGSRAAPSKLTSAQLLASSTHSSSGPGPGTPAGVVMAGVLSKVMAVVRGGPQKMQEMMMQQMMQQMMKQMGAPPTGGRPGLLVGQLPGSCTRFRK